MNTISRVKIAAILLVIFFMQNVLCNTALAIQQNNYSMSRRMLTNKEWISDINYLKTTLEKTHPDLYFKIPKASLNKQFSVLIKDVPRLTDIQIKLRLAQIIALIGDVHTQLDINNSYDRIYFPLCTKWFGNDLRVIEISKDYHENLGKKLIAINNVPIADVVKKIDKLIPKENSQILKIEDVNYIRNQEILEYFKISKGDAAQFTFEEDSGKKNKVKIYTNWMNDKVSIPDSFINKAETLYPHNDNNGIYWRKYMPEEKIYYLQYNKCIDSDTAKRLGISGYENCPDFSKASEQIMKEINKNDVDKLVIDLRYNGGGNCFIMLPLIKMLAQNEKLNQKGKILVMVGRNTLSAAVSDIFYLKSYTNAIFIGEPTGQNANYHGDIISFKLPHSCIHGACSTKIETYYSNGEYKDSFIPDIQVDESFEDYKICIDDVFQAAKNYNEVINVPQLYK